MALIALGVDYTAIFPLFLLQLLWLARGHPRPGRWLLLQAVVLAAAYLLWLDAAHRSALATSFQAFTLAVQLNRLGFEMTPADATTLLRIGGVVAILLSLVVAWQWPKNLRGLTRSPAFFLLVWLIWLGLLLFVAVPRLYSLKRQLIVLLPYITLAHGLCPAPSSSRLPDGGAGQHPGCDDVRTAHSPERSLARGPHAPG